MNEPFAYLPMLKSLLRDVQLFARHASKLRLRSYQQSVALAIVESVIERRGDTIVVLFPRQSGKNELQAQVETYLLILFFMTNAEVVKISPTWKPQSLNAMRRLERVLSRNLFTRANWKKESGYIYRVGSARIFFLSGSPEASIVGATASTLLEVDEAQDVAVSKFDKDIGPMAASTNATRVFWGTAWTSTTLLARELRAAREAEKKDGRRRVFVMTADQVAQEVPAYAKFVAEQIAKLGRNHPMVRTQFYSEEVDAEAGMFPARRQALMIGSHHRQDGPTPLGSPPLASPPERAGQAGKLYALLIDVAGEDEIIRVEEGADAYTDLHQGRAGGLANPRRDSTALTVVEIDLSSLEDPILRAPTYRVVDRRSWIGVRHSTLYAQIRALVDHWVARYVVIDATGVGTGLASFLDRAFPKRIIPFVFNAATKSKLGWDFLTIVETGRFKDYATEESQRSAFNLQLSYCQMEILPGPERRMKWGVPDGTSGGEAGEFIHDDWVLSAALCAVLDDLEWRIPVPTAVIQAVDPLRQIDREGF